ncbi:YccF domain-containing protein [Novosphingobium sp. SG751A]|uniref:YccF domain-containing protein n=1 Tax=Novosphingobium sp. SG751A TaxID=2587000 RepID=UPI0035300ADC
MVWGIANCTSIISIPFGIRHFKLAGLALFPVGKTIVTREMAQAVRNNGACAALATIIRSWRSLPQLEPSGPASPPDPC